MRALRVSLLVLLIVLVADGIAENDWLNVAVHNLDHVYALYHPAERAGQMNLIAQLNQQLRRCLNGRTACAVFLP